MRIKFFVNNWNDILKSFGSSPKAREILFISNMEKKYIIFGFELMNLAFIGLIDNQYKY